MTEVRELVFAGIEERLRAIDGVVEVEVMPSADPLGFPALHVFDSGQDPGEGGPAHQGYDLSPSIEGYVEGSGGVEAFAALNRLYGDTVRALVTEPPLNGLAETIDEGGMRVFVAELASARRLGFSLDLPITFFTRRGDPAQPA